MAAQTPSDPHHPDADPFDTLLTLEDTLYTAAYTQGAADGARAGRIEGRIFGLEKGFEKFGEMGALHGRACVWGSRLPHEIVTQPKQQDEAVASVLPPLPGSNTRLAKNIFLLHSLTDPLTFSTENDEDAVADFDDRFKRAGAKAKIIERTVGENLETQAEVLSPADEVDVANIPGPGTKKGPKKVPVRRVKVIGENKGKKEDSIEDFTGSRLLG